ncbi:MAG TPA: CatB-related O-acetyltransferase [Rhizomicrobium sp.]|nr:CatB-related O-acetyltransferase [Rhizomicrobium sp.]
MPILRTLTDRALIRLLRHDHYESLFLRRYFERHYGIKIGLYSIGFFDRWRINPGTVIGRYSGCAGTSRVIGANHPIEWLSTSSIFYLPQFGIAEKELELPPPQLIEDDVWIGHGSIITPECRVVGRGSIIGAGSVVGKDVPRYGIMIGSPARLVRYRFAPEVIEAIEATEWWTMDRESVRLALKAAPDFLTSPSVESAQAFMRATGRA